MMVVCLSSWWVWVVSWMLCLCFSSSWMLVLWVRLVICWDIVDGVRCRVVVVVDMVLCSSSRCRMCSWCRLIVKF